MKSLTSLFLVTVLSLSGTIAAAQAAENGVGLEKAAANVSTSLFTSHPSQITPHEYGVGALKGGLDSRGLALGRSLLQIELPNGRTVALKVKDIDRRGASDLAWFGGIEGSEDSDASLTLKNGLVFGRIREGGEVFELSSDLQGILTVEQIDTDRLPGCDADESHVQSGEGEPKAASSEAAAAAGDAGVLIDLLVVYSNDALADAGSVAQMHAMAQAAVDVSNNAFVNSNMNVRYRLVHTAGLDYDTGGSTSTDLSWVTNDAEVAALRNLYGADMVHLLVDTPDSCGTAWVQRNPGPGFEDDGFAVTDVDCAVGNMTFAHEHGHNMGFEHNIENSGATRESASNPWSFAHYVNGSYRTVMSYSDQCSSGCSRVSKFSNPDIIFNGLPSGVVDESDNARTGDQTAPIVSNFRSEVVPSVAAVTFAAIGDYGDGSSAESDVADLVKSWGVDFVIGAGDNRYGSISYDTSVGRDYCDFMIDVSNGSYCNGGSSATNAFFPAPGNHDYDDGGGINEYLSYFNLPGAGVQTSGTSGSERYYDAVQGPVHIFVIDSDRARSSVTDMNAQKAWLQSAMQASTTAWQVVLIHHAPYSSGSHGSYPELQWPYAEWGADAVFAGHDHIYERLSAGGIPYFVTGLGGRSIYSFGSISSNSQFRYNGDYGAMRVTASDADLSFEFLNRSGTLIDSYTIDKTPAPGNGVVNVRVSQSSDDAEELLNSGASYAAGHISLDSSDLELADDDSWHGGTQAVGLRFQNITIPQGATITAASLEFVTDETQSFAASASIRAQAVDHATTFTTSGYDISNRPVTSASVTWNMGSWNTVGEAHTSPDIAALVQEVVSRPGWQPNNSIAFVITGSGVRTAESWDGGSAAAPLLQIEYTQEGAGAVIVADADTYVRSTSNHGLESTILVKRSSAGAGSSFTRTGWVHFDLSSVSLAAPAARLMFTVDSNDTDGTLSVWGIKDGRPGDALDVDWSETALTVVNAPLLPDFSEDADTTLIGTAPLAASGDMIVIEGAAVLDFLNADTNGEVTFLLVRDVDDGNFSLRSKEHSSGGAPRLEIMSIEVNNPPQAGFSDSCINLSCNFTDTSTDSDGSIAGWLWSFGDGQTSTAQNPDHTYAAAGTYTVTLTVTDNAGATDISSASVGVSEVPNQAPTAGFTFSVNDLSVDFTDNSGDSDGSIISRSWNFGDGNISSATDPAHTYAAAGTYTVTLTVTDNDGATDTIGLQILVAEPDAVAPTITAPADVTSEATGVNTVVTLGSPTVFDEVDPNPSVTNDAPSAFPIGVTSVTWTATDDAGNSATDTQSVTVIDTTAPSITAPADISVVSGDPVDLGAPIITDLVDPNPAVMNNAPASFPLGDTLVIWTATDFSGNSATAEQAVTVTAPVAAVPAAPSNLVASVTQTGKRRDKVKSVTLTWDDNSSNEDFFVVERCEESGKGKNKICNFSLHATTTSANYSESGLSGTFKYRVSAENAMGQSAASNEVGI